LRLRVAEVVLAGLDGTRVYADLVGQDDGTQM
jgi:hypothetical protein